MLVSSGLYGDAYQLSDTKIEKRILTNKQTTTEICNLEKFQNVYGIPVIYNIKHYRNITFVGKNGNGVYNDKQNNFVSNGAGIGITMEYGGNLTLDNYKQLTKIQLNKALFNVFYICYLLYRKHGYIHGDLHRRNIVLKKTKPFSKTYYINYKKYKVNSQYYKVTMIDFDTSKKSKNEMQDVKYLCSFFDNTFIMRNRISDFIEENFNEFCF